MFSDNNSLVFQSIVVTKDQEIKELKAQLHLALNKIEKLVTITNDMNTENDSLQRQLFEIQREMNQFRKSHCDITSDNVHSKQASAK